MRSATGCASCTRVGSSRRARRHRPSKRRWNPGLRHFCSASSMPVASSCTCRRPAARGGVRVRRQRGRVLADHAGTVGEDLVEFGADEEDQAHDPDPGHAEQQGARDPDGLVAPSSELDVPAVADRRRQPADRHQHRTREVVAPRRVVVRPDVEDGRRQQQGSRGQRRPGRLVTLPPNRRPSRDTSTARRWRACRPRDRALPDEPAGIRATLRRRRRRRAHGSAQRIHTETVTNASSSDTEKRPAWFWSNSESIVVRSSSASPVNTRSTNSLVRSRSSAVRSSLRSDSEARPASRVAGRLSSSQNATLAASVEGSVLDDLVNQLAHRGERSSPPGRRTAFARFHQVPQCTDAARSDRRSGVVDGRQPGISVPAYSSRRVFFENLPTLVLGTSSIHTTPLGICHLAILPSRKASTSASVTI